MHHMSLVSACNQLGLCTRTILMIYGQEHQFLTLTLTPTMTIELDLGFDFDQAKRRIRKLENRSVLCRSVGSWKSMAIILIGTPESGAKVALAPLQFPAEVISLGSLNLWAWSSKCQIGSVKSAWLSFAIYRRLDHEVTSIFAPWCHQIVSSPKTIT